MRKISALLFGLFLFSCGGNSGVVSPDDTSSQDSASDIIQEDHLVDSVLPDEFTFDQGHGDILPECGDGECNGDETCVTCEGDCGECLPECGDGECNGDETCETCEEDCGECLPECGDGECNGD